MKRSRAFILSEQLMTIMLEAGFILVLCTSFYQLISFYTRTQQVLTARNHAERVISFMDDKIRNAGLGLWRCKSSSDIRDKLKTVEMLSTKSPSNQGYRLPVGLQNGFKHKDNKAEATPQNAPGSAYIPLLSWEHDSGNVITLLYAKRDLSTTNEEIISALKTSSTMKYHDSTTTKGKLKLLDKDNANKFKDESWFKNTYNSTNIKSYAVMEGLGVPMYVEYVYTSTSSGNDKGDVDVRVYGVQSAEEAQAIKAPAAGELLALNCIQMFVHGEDGKDEGRQFAFRELKADGSQWYDTYNQEKGILDIYMELDKKHSVLTLWVLASGGYDASLNNPRPETWPEKAQPTAAEWGKKVIDKIRDYTNYPHHIVYVSRASWKLNNIPQDFIW